MHYTSAYMVCFLLRMHISYHSTDWYSSCYALFTVIHRMQVQFLHMQDAYHAIFADAPGKLPTGRAVALKAPPVPYPWHLLVWAVCEFFG